MRPLNNQNLKTMILSVDIGNVLISGVLIGFSIIWLSLGINPGAAAGCSLFALVLGSFGATRLVTNMNVPITLEIITGDGGVEQDSPVDLPDADELEPLLTWYDFVYVDPLPGNPSPIISVRVGLDGQAVSDAGGITANMLNGVRATHNIGKSYVLTNMIHLGYMTGSEFAAAGGAS